jgi:hypothetical protein
MAKRKQLTEKDLFPHETFPYRLEHVDGKEPKVCWFQSELDLNKYLQRYKINKKNKDVKLYVKE